MLDRALGEDRDVGRAAADVDQAHTEVALVAASTASAEASGSSTMSTTLSPALFAAFHDVLCAGDGRRDDVDLRLEPHAAHAEWLADPVLVVDDELLRDHVDDLAVHRDRDRLGGIDHALDVASRDLPVLHRDDAVRVEARRCARPRCRRRPT